MSLGTLIRRSTCSPRKVLTFGHPVLLRSTISSGGHSPHRPWIRGAKTKTVVKASSLPQGALPPLAQTGDDLAPKKQYPTVLQQHLNNVRKFKDCIVLTRVGDFYEMYFDQVDEYAPLVNLKKAKRATALGDVAMAGFQHASLDRYLKMFVQDLGKQVAISEQIRLPESEREGRAGAPMYDRKVTRVITAGTLIDENFMDPYENNFLLAVHLDASIRLGLLSEARKEPHGDDGRSQSVGLGWVDLSSGDFFTQHINLASLSSLVARIRPREIVLDQSLESTAQLQLNTLLGEGAFSVHFHQVTAQSSTAAEWSTMLEQPVPKKEVSAFSAEEIVAGNLVLDYVKEKLIGQQIKLQPPIRRSEEENLSIDKQSLRGLEIRSTLRDGTFQGSLLHAVRQTVTKSGARLLSQRLVSPSMSLTVINRRLDLAQELLNHDALREDVVALLRRTADTLRLLQRFSIGKGDADDLLSLARTVDLTVRLAKLLQNHIEAQQSQNDGVVDFGFLMDIVSRLDTKSPSVISKRITDAIDEDGLNRQHVAELQERSDAEESAEEAIAAGEDTRKTAKSSRRTSKKRATAEELMPEETWIMRRRASSTLERAHSDLDDLMGMKSDLAQVLRRQLKNDSLTMKWSAQLGHFCHIKGKEIKNELILRSDVRSVGSTKSTKSFYVDEWTQLAARIDESKLRIRTEEERVFTQLRNQVLENLMTLRRNAAVLDELDVGCSSATVAKQRGLVRPILNESTTHKIVGGRHPTVDASLKDSGRLFTANDCAVGDREKIYLITGPNMAGKSTYLRQNALITILAQTGCFVPADYAEIGLVDKIFSRVGSADNLYQDQSTFMVEMLETAEILKQATPRSFVIMDEVGRGTTPEDGIAVGYACLHHLHNVNRSRTLFATHFHALADMTSNFSALACYCTDIAEEDDGSWAYVHRLRRGVNRKSHALKVARLAGLPESAVEVAGAVLADMQRPESAEIEKPSTYAASA
ncbi:muts domain V [Hortaea werneckii]|nr:muts domain V [Hortaea werneckii]KAI7275080.1 muts domain V [Hortaea werneckii]KAI7417236.1 muts domain V [Hortaea werneckii]KAI7450191.1 muts domain V [Hortaea werneckii]